MVQVLQNPVPLPSPLPASAHLSVVSYNVLLPNSVDGWWTYKMYNPPVILQEDQQHVASWDYRQDLLKNRLAVMDADVVCLQEVAPDSFVDDFKFMQDLGYDGVEMFKKGRFRPATFWKTNQLELTSPPVHKDRTLLTCFRRKKQSDEEDEERQPVGGNNWYVLNVHLQAGQQGPRRIRQINEGVKSVLTLSRKQKEKDPEKSIRLIVCGDFNGGEECGAVRYLEDGSIDETFMEEGVSVTSSKKSLPLCTPLTDVAKTAATTTERDPPPTMVVSELIQQMVGEGDAYENPKLSKELVERLTTIYERFATHIMEEDKTKQMNINDVENWLTKINLQVGRGDEYREASRQMGWVDPDPPTTGDSSSSYQQQKARITMPGDGILSLEGFLQVYQKELEGGKFWGIAHDLAVLGEPLPNVGVFAARYDRMYCSAAIKPVAVVDTICNVSCPNEDEPSDHLPVAAVFTDQL